MRRQLLVPVAAAVALGVGIAACKTIPKTPQTLDDWLALARDGQNAVAVAEELARRRAQCDKISKEPVAWEEERSIGGAAATRWTQQLGGLLIDVPQGKKSVDLSGIASGEVPEGDAKKLTVYLNTVGRLLATRSERPSLPWMFGVTKSDAVNAYSTPGGTVLVTRGLMKVVENESQLAGVLAHEIAHVTGRHAINAYQRNKAEVCDRAFFEALSDKAGLSESARNAAAGAAKSFDALLKKNTGGFINFDDSKLNLGSLVVLGEKVADGIYDRHFGREDELDADRTATALLVAAGYNPREYSTLIAKLPVNPHADASHPPPADRTREVEKVLSAQNPASNPFGYADYPFDKRATVSLPEGLAAKLEPQRPPQE